MENIDKSSQRFYPNGSAMSRNCPNCGAKLNIGKLLRMKKPTKAQSEQARINGSLGGRPPLKSKKGERKN